MPADGGRRLRRRERPRPRRHAPRRRRAAREALDDGADFVVGLLVPINGSAGIWGPSSIACAQLAQAEINADGGLLDRRVRLRIIDSSDEATEVGSVTAELMHAGAIDAIVGMHTSQVRQRVLKDVARQIPYVYTPLYEGGERTPGVFAIGETPGQQLRPAIEYLAEPLSRAALDVHRQRLRLAARLAPPRGALRGRAGRRGRSPTATGRSASRTIPSCSTRSRA